MFDLYEKYVKFNCLEFGYDLFHLKTMLSHYAELNFIFIYTIFNDGGTISYK